MSCVSQEVKDIYYLLEHEFLPSDLALKVLPLLNKISKLGGKFTFASSVLEVQLSQYVPALEKLATLRLLQHVNCLFLLFIAVCYLFSACDVYLNLLSLLPLLGF
jgi:translation initiation factor 3 subunit A